MLVCGMIFLQAGVFAVPSSGKGYSQADDDNGRVVTGKVISAVDNEPVPGAFVVEKGTDNGVMTLDDGSYSIRVKGTNAQLEISCVGFKTGTYEIGKLGIVDVALESDSELDEAIVVGMGTQKKVSVIGAVSSIQGGALRSSSSNLTSNIAGKLAGVISMTNSGDPGAASEFYIRGINTFGGVSTPLILLDDVEISANDLNRIPPESIKSFTVLKDASATAIYGVRGANGVMIVTTKNGSENMRTQVNATVETMITQPVNMVDFVDGPTWMELYNEVKQPALRYPLDLWPNNRVMISQDFPVVENLVISPGAERRFFIKAKLNLNSVDVESPASAIAVQPAPPEANPPAASKSEEATK